MKRALIVRGGWEGHEPVAGTDLFVPFLQEEGFEIRIEGSNEVYADGAYMASVDLIVQSVSMSTIGKPEVTGLRDAIASGTGFAGWHGGIIDSYRDCSDYLQLVGASFAAHPGRKDVDPATLRYDQERFFVPFTVEIDTSVDHEITRGVPDFDLVTENYWVLADSYSDVLARTRIASDTTDPWSREVISPAVFTRTWGAGRIFACTPGHNPDVLQNPNVSTIVKRGLLWASR